MPWRKRAGLLIENTRKGSGDMAMSIVTQPIVTIKEVKKGRKILAWRCTCDQWNYWTNKKCTRCQNEKEQAITTLRNIRKREVPPEPKHHELNIDHVRKMWESGEGVMQDRGKSEEE